MDKTFLTVASLITLATVPAAAQLVVGGTYNTGYVGSTAITAGGSDFNFQVGYTGPGPLVAFGAPVVPTEIPSGWTSTPGAQFISPSADQAYPPTPYEGNLPGDYDYHTSILNGFIIPTEITISGSFAADNTVEIGVNGTIVVPFASTSPNSEFAGPLTPFSFTVLATPGVSTGLDFIVENYNSDNSDPFTTGTDGHLNPTGLLVSNLKITVAPEPSTWAMMILGFGALFVLPRLRRVLAL
jgi:hypothetical protein